MDAVMMCWMPGINGEDAVEEDVDSQSACDRPTFRLAGPKVKGKEGHRFNIIGCLVNELFKGIGVGASSVLFRFVRFTMKVGESFDPLAFAGSGIFNESFGFHDEFAGAFRVVVI